MGRTSGIGAALVYFLIVGVLASAIGLFWRLTLLPVLAGDEASPLATRALGLDEAPLVSFLLSPLYLLLSLGIAALIVHFMLWLTGGARRGLDTTTRVLAFAYGPQLFVVVPLLGAVIAGLWMLVLSIVGLREAHETDGWRAAMAVLVPFAGLLFIFMLIALALMAGDRLLPGVLDPA
jgi:hypothetical protein